MNKFRNYKLLLATLILVLPATSAGADSSPPLPMAKAATLAGPLDALIAQAKTTFGQEYAGADLTASGPVLYIKGAATSLPGTFQKAKIIPAKYSFVELQVAQAALDSNYSTLKTQGILLGEWGIDVARNRVYAKVFLTDSQLSAAEAADAIRTASGQSDLEFSTLDRLPVSTSRTSDGTPHYGGAQISTTDNTFTNYCTSGFYWSDGHMMTAGHCGPVMTIWSSGSYSFGTTTYSALYNHSSPNRQDWSAIALSGTGAGRFYISALGSLHVASYFTGTQAGVTGIRTSGAITGD